MPLKAFCTSELTRNGKKKYIICNNTVDHIEFINGTPHKVYDSYISSGRDYITDFIEVPCGKCVGCRLDHSKTWADRCMLELMDHDSSYFVTLTYDDDHLPLSPALDEETGEYDYNNGMFPTLRKRDFQLFMKRLRSSFPEQKLRYFACGEYGTNTHRPHYHAIIFGLSLSDLIVYKKTGLGDTLYNSPSLSAVWPYGHVVIGSVTYESCAYTARYVVKKASDSFDVNLFKHYDLEPEFVLMSRRPGIARNWYERNKDTLFDFEYTYLTTEKGSIKIKPCRYFKKCFDAENLSYGLTAADQIAHSIGKNLGDLEEMQEGIARNVGFTQLRNSSLSRYEQLKVDEEVKKSQLKKLLRKEL